MVDNEPETSAEASPPEPKTLGELLRRARVAQELTVEQIATELRIESKHISALEDDRLEEIGIPVFVKGYLKQYGHRLGVDVRDLLALYYRQTKLADVQVRPNRPITLRNERQIRGWILAAIALLTVAAGLAVWWWRGGSFDIIGAVTRTLTPPAQSTAVAEESTAPPPVAAAPAPIAAGGDDAESVANAASDPAPEPAADSAPEPAADAAPEPAANPILSFRADAGRVPVVPLEIELGSDSWTEVTDGTGERLAYGLQRAGRRLTVRGSPPFDVVLGDASAARVTIDGLPYPIPPTRRGDNFVRFSVDVAEE